MIYNFKDLADKLNWQKKMIKQTKNKSKETFVSVGISKFKQVFVSRDQVNQLKFKTNFDEEFQILNARTKKEHCNVQKYELIKAYKEELGLPKAKIKDLLKLCEKEIIPVQYHEFFRKFKERAKDDVEQLDEDESEKE